MAMTFKPIDPKYMIAARHSENGEIEVEIVNKAGLAPMEDEPLMLLRGRDTFAVDILSYYLELCTKYGCSAAYCGFVRGRLRAAEEFRANNPERVKLPE